MIRWGRVLRLTLFVLLIGLVGVDVGLAWIFVGGLIRPLCAPPAFLPDFPSPEIVQLNPEDGLLLPAWYYPSQNGAAILAMGGNTGALGANLPEVAPLLEAGYGVLQLSARVCATPARPVTLGALEVRDAAAGLAFLQARAEVDPARIGVFGFSMGGAGAIRAAAREVDIAAVLAEGGYFNLGKDIVEPEAKESLVRKVFLYTIADVFWLRTGANPWQISPVDEIGAISPRPVFLIYGEFEADSGRAQAQFDAAGEPKALWIVPGGDHGQNYRVAPEEYTRRVVTFFEQTLGK